MKQFKQFIFSKRKSEDRQFKFITILGFTVKLKRKKKVRSFRYILKKQDRVARYLRTCIDRYQNGDIPKVNLVPKKRLGTEKIIWQYWGQGLETAPKIVKACMDSVDKYKGDYIVIRLTDDTIKDYIDIPDFLYKRLHSKSGLTRTFFSDLLRVFLLATYGGVWLDATIYLMREIDDNLLQKDFFAYQRDKNLSDEEKTFWIAQNRDYFGFTDDFRVNLLSSFMVAKRGHLILEALRDILVEYCCKHRQKMHYFMLHILFNELVKIEPYRSANCEIVSDTLSLNLGKYLACPYSDELWHKIKSESVAVQKLGSYPAPLQGAILNKLYGEIS